MTVGELIDELLDFKLADEINYCNVRVKTVAGEKWDLSKIDDLPFEKFTSQKVGIFPESLPDAGQRLNTA